MTWQRGSCMPVCADGAGNHVSSESGGTELCQWSSLVMVTGIVVGSGHRRWWHLRTKRHELSQSFGPSCFRGSLTHCGSLVFVVDL